MRKKYFYFRDFLKIVFSIYTESNPRYAANLGPVNTGLGFHIVPGLGFWGALAALCCWLPW